MNVTGLEAVRQCPFYGRRIAGITGVFPVGVPAFDDVKMQCDPEALTGLDTGLFTEQRRAQVRGGNHVGCSERIACQVSEGNIDQCGGNSLQQVVGTCIHGPSFWVMGLSIIWCVSCCAGKFASNFNKLSRANNVDTINRLKWAVISCDFFVFDWVGERFKSLHNSSMTSSPAVTGPCDSGNTIKQLALTVDVRIAEPCFPVWRIVQTNA